MNIFYVTSNQTKFDEACHVLYAEPENEERYSITLQPLELEELQGSCRHIAHHKCIQAYKQLKAPVIIDDVSVHCPALGGLPGPYIRSFLEHLGEAGFYEMISHYEDRRCFITCTIGFLENAGDEPHIFEGTVNATIVPPQGTLMHGKHSWNRIVQMEGFEKTVGQMTLSEFSQISHRGRAIQKLKQFLLERSQ